MWNAREEIKAVDKHAGDMGWQGMCTLLPAHLLGDFLGDLLSNLLGDLLALLRRLGRSIAEEHRWCNALGKGG